MKKILPSLFFLLGIFIFMPKVYAQSVSSPACAFCGIRLTSSTKPWDHKSTCCYYKAKTVVSTSSSSCSSGEAAIIGSLISSHSKGSLSSQAIMMNGITSILGSALVNAMSSSNEKKVTNIPSSLVPNLETRIIDNGSYKRMGIWDKDLNKWFMQPETGYSKLYPQPNGEVISNIAGLWGVTIPFKQANFDVIKQKYEQLYTWNGGGPYVVSKGKKQWGVSKCGKKKKFLGTFYAEIPILPCIYDTVIFMGRKDIYSFSLNGKYGLATTNGIRIPLKYEDTDPYTSPYKGQSVFAAKLNGKYGIIDTLDNVVIPFEYELLRHCPVVSNYYFAKKNGKYGLFDIETNTTIIPFKYDNLCDFEPDEEIFNMTNVDIKEVGKHLVQAKVDDKYGLLNYKNEMIAPVKYKSLQELNTQALLYPQTSFVYYLKKLDIAHHKGEFETEVEYEARQKDPTLQEAYLIKQKPSIEKSFIEWTLKNIKNPFTFKLKDYDASNEMFEFVNYATQRHTYLLFVPRKEAEHFKECFESIQTSGISTSKCFIDNDAISIAEVNFTTPEGKTYKYVNPACKETKWPISPSLLK